MDRARNPTDLGGSALHPPEEARVDDPRVDAHSGDPGTLQPRGQPPGVQHVGELAGRVGPQGAVLVALEVGVLVPYSTATRPSVEERT